MRKNAIENWRGVVRAVCFSVAILIAGLALPVRAQGVNAETSELLKKKIPFDAAPRTLAEVTRMLSAQTGVTIEAEVCLLERTVVIQNDRNSAFELLTALEELYDWRLEVTQDHKIMIKRPTVKPAASLQEVPRSIQMALPKDLRNYLGFGVPTDSLPLPAEPGQQATLKAQQALGPTVLGNLAIKFRIDEKTRHVQQALVDQALPEVGRSKLIKWSRLEKPTQTTLLLALLLRGLQRAYSSAGGEAVLSQRLYPFQVDPTRIELKLRGDELLIGTTTSTEKTRSFDGFGGVIRR